MAAITIAKGTLAKGMITTDLLNTLVEKEHLTKDLVEKIRADPDLEHFFSTTPSKAKSKPKKKSIKKASNSSERNVEGYDSHRCSARLWKPADEEGNPSKSGKYGLDNVQCLTAKMDGSCWCEKHQKIDEAMGGYWLGKVNEPRPEKLHQKPV